MIITDACTGGGNSGASWATVRVCNRTLVTCIY